MTIIACLKFVPAGLYFGSQQLANAYSLNPYDLYMLEHLMAFKKTFPCRVIGVTMGPKGCVEFMQRYIAMGLDDIYLVNDPSFAGSDTYATSYILYRALAHIGKADLYVFGEKSIDGETSQVPIGVSSHLELLCLTGIKGIKASNSGCIHLHREFMKNMEVIEAACQIAPFSICFSGFTTKEPEISLMQLKRSRSHPPRILDASSFQIEEQYCGQDGSKTRVVQTTNLVSKRCVKTIEGSHTQKACVLKDLLSKRGVYV